MSARCITLAAEVTDLLERSLSTPNITIIVGKSKDARKFYIHQGLACQHSEFFTAKMRGVAQYETEPMTLEEETPELFEMFARFLYSGKVYSRVEGDSSAAQGRCKEWLRIVQAWRLGDKLQSPSFKDAVVDTTCEKMVQDGRYPTKLYRHAYPHTSMDAPLRRLIVDIATWSWHADTFEETAFHGSWNQFFRDLALRQHEVGQNGQKGPAPFKIPSCKYHEHGYDSPCYKTMF